MNRIVLFGIVFGFILSRVGATEFDAIFGMFRLTDLHLFGVIGLAVATAGVGFAIVKRRHAKAADGVPMAIVAKPMKPGLVAGGLLFGAGWALTGTCPGTALAQVGEGTLAGGLTILGIVLGAYLHSLIGRRQRPADAAHA